MKYILAFFILIITSGNAISLPDSAYPDSSRSGDKTTTKERIRKGGSNDSPSSEYYSNVEDESFTGTCFSACISGFIIGIFGDDEEDYITPADSNFSYTHDVAEDANNPIIADEYADLPSFRNYIRAGFDLQSLVGSHEGTIEEYKDAALGYRISNQVYFKGFVINSAFSQSFQNGEPLYDYTYTIKEGNNVTLNYYDEVHSIFLKNTSLTLGLGYMFNINTEFGLQPGSGLTYQTFTEETELTRYNPFNSMSSNTNITETLKFSDLYPYLSLDLFFLDGSMMADLNFQYTFINRHPQGIKSTPLDWNELDGQFTISIGFNYNIL